ncbi:DNA methyltransferase [Tessaracoccus lacteus]|uniref:site-specific DNA-methyltransferase (adenine-specific) n=1 Tax=Tessaracoccus lacteus TaxID=3041766 RepID=A0ABY8PXU6_9ACTN|nr:DNA methyltransferase [Tessaracoccus sp. T21]WGT47294.1 N-6 DNA methylase [Tessaracoccus sp. T21]
MAGESFVGVRVQGGLIPAELLSRISVGALPGQSSADYHLAPGESVREAANRAWAYLTGVWATYRQAAERLPESDRGTSLTRERWLLILLRELGFGRVSTTPAGGLQVEGKSARISHLWEQVPIHLLGHRVELDRRTQGVAGAASQSPQSMVQELLNRSDEHLWAVLSNGVTLRLLRDSTSLVGSSYVEFDLEAIFDGDLFADFLVLFSVCHESRLAIRDPQKGAASCWLEAWRGESLESGTRALDQLRDGVREAITTLGTGFLAHHANGALRDSLTDGTLRIEDVNHALLRVVYRLLFTFVAEDRGLLLDPDAAPSTRQRYVEFFSTARLRRIARRRRGTRHTDQWRALNLVWDGLGSVDGRPELGLIGIGGLYDAGPLDVFRNAELSNEALLRAVRQLSLIEEAGSRVRRVVDYRNLGAEELGSIYETLLEYVPSWDAGRRKFELLNSAGNDRKSTGSYYTPTSLIECLLDSALDPVLDRAERQPDPESALLSLTVCDPACGSGHFLVAAARRIAKRVATIRTGDPEPPPERIREALSDVVGRCIYGVDINPLAAELAKVSLWLETLDPGRPLAFLDAQIKVGNSLMGTTPGLISGGVPDDAFAVLEGDDKKVTAALKKQNKAERAGQDELFAAPAPTVDPTLAQDLASLITGIGAASLADVHARQQKLHALESDPAVQRLRLVADAWCASFVWPKLPGAPKAITDSTVRSIERGESLPADTADTIQALATEYRFFHWHVEFPTCSAPAARTRRSAGPEASTSFSATLHGSV